jgi:hypothetical protein
MSTIEIERELCRRHVCTDVDVVAAILSDMDSLKGPASINVCLDHLNDALVRLDQALQTLDSAVHTSTGWWRRDARVDVACIEGVREVKTRSTIVSRGSSR